MRLLKYALLTLTASAAFAQITTPNATSCRGWKTTKDPLARSMFLLGGIDILSGFVAQTAKTGEELGSIIEPFFPFTFSIIEAREGVDKFCERPENGLVSVFNSLRIVSMKAKGGSPAEVEKASALMRKIAYGMAEIDAATVKKTAK